MLWGTKPNRLNPVYDVSFVVDRVAAPNYVHVHDSLDSRRLYQAHGILFEVSLIDHLGKLSTVKVLLLFIECGVVFAVAKRIIFYGGLLLMGERDAKKIEDVIYQKPVEFDDQEELDESMG